MANINFEMVGKIHIGKESEKFKPYLANVYPSGWNIKQIKFSVVCGDNNHLLTATSKTFTDERGVIYTFSKGGVDKNGNRIKGESLKIPFKNRLLKKNVDKIAEFKKFVIDLEVPGRRYKLENLAEKMKEGVSPTDEELKAVGLENEDQVEAALAESQKKRHEFISEWDFIDLIKEITESGEYSNKKFFIRGEIKYTYNSDKDRVYENYVPNRIYLAADDTEESSTATLSIIYNKDSLDELSVEEKGKYYVNGYVMAYDENDKRTIPVPVTIVINEAAPNATDKEKKFVSLSCKKFIVKDDTYKELGVVVNMLNGAQKTHITEDMLTDEQREDIECGLLTEEDIINDLGGSVYGDRIKEYQFVKIGKGYSKGREDTAYTNEDMVITPIEDEESEEKVDSVLNDESDEETEEDEQLFDDDEI